MGRWGEKRDSYELSTPDMALLSQTGQEFHEWYVLAIKAIWRSHSALFWKSDHELLLNTDELQNESVLMSDFEDCLLRKYVSKRPAVITTLNTSLSL